MAELRTGLHPEKTKIVDCKDDLRKKTYPNEKFDFLGYTFQPRRSKNRKGSSSSISVRQSRIRQRRQSVTNFVAGNCRSAVIKPSKTCRGCSIRLSGAGSCITDDIIVRLFTRRCANWTEIWPCGPSGNTRSLRHHLRRATHWIARISRRAPELFAHWQMGARRGSMMGAV